VREIAEATAQAVAEAVPAAVVAIHLVDGADLDPCAAALVEGDDDARSLQRALAERRCGPTSMLARPLLTRVPVDIADVSRDATFAVEWGRGLAAQHWFALPIRAVEDSRGVLTVVAPDDVTLDHDFLSLLGDVSALFGQVVERASLRYQHELVHAVPAMFIERAGHQLGGLVAALGVASSTLRDRGDRLTEDGHRQLVATMVTVAEQLREKVALLLEIAELERGARQLRVQPVEVASVIESVAVDLSWPLEQPVTLDLEPRLVAVDPDALRQIIDTLLENALHHGGPHVSVTVRAKGHMVFVTVTDDGPGLEPNGLARHFEPFSRGRNADRDGSGFALALSRRLARACGGDLVNIPGVSCHSFVLSLREAS
jgi:signal transduction histidine kinase